MTDFSLDDVLNVSWQDLPTPVEVPAGMWRFRIKELAQKVSDLRGAEFLAVLTYEQDRNDPTKKWPRLSRFSPVVA